MALPGVIGKDTALEFTASLTPLDSTRCGAPVGLIAILLHNRCSRGPMLPSGRLFCLFSLVSISACIGHAQSCAQPLCVTRADDSAASPVSGMLRYAVMNAPLGATITFGPALSGQVIT